MNTNQKTLGQIAMNGYSACLSDEHEDRWEFAAQAVRQHVLATETDDGWRLLDVLRQHVDSMRCERNKLKEELATSKKCLVIANRSADDQMQQKREAQKERDSLRAELLILRYALGFDDSDKIVLDQTPTVGSVLIQRGASRVRTWPASSEVIALEDENKSLRSQLTESQKRVEELEKERDELKEYKRRTESAIKRGGKYVLSGNVITGGPCGGFTYTGRDEFSARLLHAELSELASRLAIKAPAEKSPWIPCSERLPDYSEEPDGSTACVFVHHETAPLCSSPFQMSNVAYLRKHPEEYTHWMPIPPLPKPQEDEFKEWWNNSDWSAGTKTESIARDAWNAAALASRKEKP